MRWADGGKTMTWALGNTFYRLTLSSALEFARAERRKAEEKEKAKAAEGKSPGQTDKDKEDKEKEKVQEAKVPKAETIAIALAMPRGAPQGSYVLKGARVVTMKGDEVLETADIFVTGNRIAAVGPSGSVAVPAGTRTFDGAGKTVIPGLIDTHAHLHYSAFELFPEAKWEYYANLAYGVTTTYDPSAPSLDVFAQGEQVEAGVRWSGRASTPPATCSTAASRPRSSRRSTRSRTRSTRSAA